MKGFLAGASLVAAVAAALYWLVLLPGADEDCGGRCSDGTQCVDARCVVTLDPGPTTEEPATDTGKRKRKRRKKRRGGADKDDGDAGTSVKFVSDAGVPRHDPKKAKVIGEGTGSERLSDRVINRELAKLDGAFQRCVEIAASATDEDLPSARVTYQFGIGPDGRVTGVNARAPKALADLGVVACVRKAVHDHRFPKFDGLEMSAEGSFSI